MDRGSLMQKSNIAWTDTTWNPVHGCSKVSAGCDNCYAERISRQYGHTEHEWTNEHVDENVTTRPDKLEEPYTLDEPSRVFVNSMSDLFHSKVPESFIGDVFGVMRNCPEHVFQILTKRPGRAANLTLEWPENVWVGTSVEDAWVVPRIGILRGVDAYTRFISFEPLIGPVGNIDLSGIAWAIVGGESGPDHREMEHSWARDIYRQCREKDTAFFFKQSSGARPETGTALTVKNERFGVYEQRKIRELPDVPQSTIEAREHLAATDGGRYGEPGTDQEVER